MWIQLAELAATIGPWFALLALMSFLGWTVVLVREFTRGHLARSGRPFMVKLWGLSIEVGPDHGKTDHRAASKDGRAPVDDESTDVDPAESG